MNNTAATKEKQKQAFIETARELGADPDDPRVLEALKGMSKRSAYLKKRMEALQRAKRKKRASKK